MVLKLLANIFVSQKVESVHFYSCLKQNYPSDSYHYPPGKRKLLIPPEQRFLEIHFSPAERGRIMELKK